MKKHAAKAEAELYAGVALAYIKQITLAQARALGAIDDDMVLSADVTLYAIHAADGTPLAVVDDYAAAHAAALQHEFTPVRVH